MVVAVVAGGVWLVYFSSVLTVKRVDVEGNDLLTRNQVLKTARVPAGEQLARVDLDADRGPAARAGRRTCGRRLPASGPTAC